MKRLALLLAPALFLFAGCAVWKTSHEPAEQFLAAKHPENVRVTLADKRRIPIVLPSVRGDSLAGYWGESDLAEPFIVNDPEHFPPVAVSLSDIRKLEWRHIDPVRTTLVLVGIGATVVLVVAGIALSTSGGIHVPPEAVPDVGGAMSCPLLYSYDGTAWQLDSGTYGGAILKPLARTDVDNLEHASPVNGRVELRMTDEADETEFVDAISLLAVDHEPGIGVAPDAAGQLHSFAALVPPLAAYDFDGRDALARVCHADDRSWESQLRPRDPEELRDGLVMSFPRPRGARAALVVTGHNTPWTAFLVRQMVQAHGSDEPAWQREAEAHPVEARAAHARLMREGMLEVSVFGERGWEPAGVIGEAGPEVAKCQVVTLDLSCVLGDTVRVRLASIPNFWLVDQVALAAESNAPLVTHEMILATATDSTGNDLRPLLNTMDEQTYRMPRGAVARLTFADPPQAGGLERTYLARTSGWYRVGCDTTRAPDTALLTRLATEPHAAARLAIERANQALQRSGMEVLP